MIFLETRIEIKRSVAQLALIACLMAFLGGPVATYSAVCSSTVGDRLWKSTFSQSQRNFRSTGNETALWTSESFK